MTRGGSPGAPLSRCLRRQRGSAELYQEQDLGFWPGRTKPEFPFHSQPLSASLIREGTDTVLGKSAFFWDYWGENDQIWGGFSLERGLGWNRGPTAGLGSGMNPLEAMSSFSGVNPMEVREEGKALAPKGMAEAGARCRLLKYSQNTSDGGVLFGIALIFLPGRQLHSFLVRKLKSCCSHSLLRVLCPVRAPKPKVPIFLVFWQVDFLCSARTREGGLRKGKLSIPL